MGDGGVDLSALALRGCFDVSPILLAVLLAIHAGQAAPAPGAVFGATSAHRVQRGESLIEIARRYDVGFNEIAAANPRLDPFVPKAGAVAIVPTSWILPAAAAPGRLVVNLSEMRLYLVSRRGPPVTFPIGVAVEADATPLGVLAVTEKSVEPTWYPTPSILREDPTLPVAVPPGPENPLGSHALRLSNRTILIHGTNRPFGVGRRVSHGCIRLYPEDIPLLYALVRIGTPVVIVREPVKLGLRQGRVFMEVHDDETLGRDAFTEAVQMLRDRALLDRIDLAKLARTTGARRGIPVDVTADER